MYLTGGAVMATKAFETPALYGDHHVLEVRKILLDIPGVKEVYASSGFQTIEVTYDPKKVKANAIKTKLEEAGYLGEIPLLAETGVSAYGKDDDDGFFRHTEVYETVKQTVSFSQRVQYQGRPLWPCPGFGVVKMDE
jgi:copper chaperone CopZ